MENMKVCLSSVLKREMKVKGESINSLSRACRIPVSVLHGWVNGTLPSAKNLHHIQSLSDYLGVSIAMLLFNRREEKSGDSVLFSSEFADGDMKYRLLVEKVRRG